MGTEPAVSFFRTQWVGHSGDGSFGHSGDGSFVLCLSNNTRGPSPCVRGFHILCPI